MIGGQTVWTTKVHWFGPSGTESNGLDAAKAQFNNHYAQATGDSKVRLERAVRDLYGSIDNLNALSSCIVQDGLLGMQLWLPDPGSSPLFHTFRDLLEFNIAEMMVDDDEEYEV